MFILRRYLSSFKVPNLFCISEEVEKCLLTKGNIVALESTVITHGLPYPNNLK